MTINSLIALILFILSASTTLAGQESVAVGDWDVQVFTGSDQVLDSGFRRAFFAKSRTSDVALHCKADPGRDWAFVVKSTSISDWNRTHETVNVIFDDGESMAFPTEYDRFTPADAPKIVVHMKSANRMSIGVPGETGQHASLNGVSAMIRQYGQQCAPSISADRPTRENSLPKTAMSVAASDLVLAKIYGEYEGKTPALWAVELEGKTITVEEALASANQAGSGYTLIELEDYIVCTVRDGESQKMAATARTSNVFDFVGRFQRFDGRHYRFDDCKLWLRP